MNERLRQIRIALNLSQNKFGNVIGLSGSTINDIEHNRCKVNKRLMISICAKFNVNEVWFETGEGNMFNSDNRFNEFFEIFSKLSKPLQDFLLETAKNLLEAQKNL